MGVGDKRHALATLAAGKRPGSHYTKRSINDINTYVSFDSLPLHVCVITILGETCKLLWTELRNRKNAWLCFMAILLISYEKRWYAFH